MLCILVLFLGFNSQLMADITGVTLQVSSSAPDGAAINGSGQVTLQAGWTGDTPPYSAAFKAGDNTLGTESTSQNQATYVVSGAVLGHGDKSFKVVVLESSVPNAEEKEAPGDKTIKVDLQAPNLTAQVTNGSVFANTQSVRIQVTATDEVVRAPTVSCNGVVAAIEGSGDPGTSFVYNLQLDDTFTNGQYTVNVTAKDNTEPESGANTGTTSVDFTVGSAASGDTEISASSPPSPTNSASITLNGTCPSGTSSIEVQEGGSTIATVSVSGTNWSVGLAPDEGSHTYRAISKDTNGTQISTSDPFTVVVDRTPPAKPVADSSGLPANTNQNSVTIPVSVSGLDTEVAEPVTIQAIVNGVDSGTAQVVNSSPIDMAVALSEGTNSITFRLSDAAGNTSEISDAVTIVKNTSSGSSSTIVTLNSPVTMSFPIANNYMLGAGVYEVKMVFDRQMDGATNPVIDITTGGGSNINSSSGNWVASTTFIGQFTIPSNGGSAYDGAAQMVVSSAKDVYGNTLDPVNVPSGGGDAFFIDCTPPTSDFDSTETIYVSSSSADVSLSGTVNDTGSGVGYVELVWQEFNGSALASKTVPIMASSPSPWSIDWDTSGQAPGRYKLWVRASDQAKPAGNENFEDYLGKEYRIVIVDRDVPAVTRISLGNMATDINNMNGGAPPVVASAVTRLTAVISDMGDSGIDFNDPDFEFSLKFEGTGNEILGNKSNNGNDTIYFDFPELTENGTYTVTVIPVDQGGNVGVTATRSFVLDTVVDGDVEFYPGNQEIANETHIALSQDQVWATIADPQADFNASTIEVKYNGNVVGDQLAGASTTAVVWDLYGATGTLPQDQSGDGRYDVTVVPKDRLGNVGTPQRAYFNYDSVPPVITSFEPDVDLSSSDYTWFGLDVTQLKVTLSDAPKDIIDYKDNMIGGGGGTGFDFSTVQVSQDPNWYNSNGSGVNTTNSSFTYTFMGMPSDPAFVEGNTLVQPRPEVTNDDGSGVIDVNMQLIALDQVNSGQVIPNTTRASYTLKFDYLEPNKPTVSKPSASDKYCGDTVTFEGTASDQGTSDEIKIKTIEWSENGSVYSEMAVSGLPAQNASYSASIDISSAADGSYEVYIRSIDLGGNYSEPATARFQIDRTPPPAPELVVPLPDAITNKRGQLFKWASVSDADNYLIQIADDGSFNNILNAQPSTDFPNEIGQITVMEQSSFSVPKDGTYFWRVAAIEKCVDGYNIGEFSATRRFTVDTVKPTVVSVSPAPSSGNKITTGMVTFTIRFSELVDTSIPPSVRLTSNGGQVMNVEMVTYKEDTWTGTTVIPKNDSALYDGNAIISIENAKDRAGNTMAVDSSNNVIINTGPAFKTRIFSNPANEFEIMIVTKSSEALQAPPTCTVEQSSSRTPVVMNFLKERFYAGSYKIDVETPGKAYIDLSGTDLHGMVGYDSLQFTVAELSESVRLNITSATGKSSLKAAEGSAYVETPIYLLDREYLDSPFSQEIRASMMPDTVQKSRNGHELVPVLALDEVGPASLRLKKCMLYAAEIDDLETNVPSEKLALYRLNKDGFWVYQGGEIRDGKIKAQLTGMGRLAIMADLTAPSVKDQYPADMDELEDQRPEFSGKLVDYGSGFKRKSMEMFIDSVPVKDFKLNLDGSFSYKPRFPMKKGKHEVTIVAEDLAGNELRHSFWVTTLGPFAVDQFMPYPNPATGNKIYFNYNFNQTADKVKLRIYDTSGDKVAEYDSFDFVSKRQGRFRWDLRTDSGRKVANGVYFYKLDISKNGRTFKKRGKFAVMR
jgi:hypothetical protein